MQQRGASGGVAPFVGPVCQLGDDCRFSFRIGNQGVSAQSDGFTLGLSVTPPFGRVRAKVVAKRQVRDPVVAISAHHVKIEGVRRPAAKIEAFRDASLAKCFVADDLEPRRKRFGGRKRGSAQHEIDDGFCFESRYCGTSDVLDVRLWHGKSLAQASLLRRERERPARVVIENVYQLVYAHGRTNGKPRSAVSAQEPVLIREIRPRSEARAAAAHPTRRL